MCSYIVYVEPTRRTVADSTSNVATVMRLKLRTDVSKACVYRRISPFKISSSEFNSDDDSEYNYIPGIYPEFETGKAGKSHN